MLDGFREVNYMVQLKVLEDEAVVTTKLAAARESLAPDPEPVQGRADRLPGCGHGGHGAEQRAHGIDPAAEPLGGQRATDRRAGRWLGWADADQRQGVGARTKCVGTLLDLTECNVGNGSGDPRF